MFYDNCRFIFCKNFIYLKLIKQIKIIINYTLTTNCWSGSSSQIISVGELYCSNIGHVCVFSTRSKGSIWTQMDTGQLSQKIWCFSNISSHSPFSTDWGGTWYLRSLSRIESFKFSFEEWLSEIFTMKNIKITTSGRSEITCLV